MGERITVVIAKNRGIGSEQKGIERDLLVGLSHLPDVSVIVVPHLYDLQPEGPAVDLLHGVSGNLVVLSWIYPRAAYWVLDANGVRGRMGRSRLVPDEEIDDGPPRSRRGAAPDRTIWCLDLRTQSEAGVLLEEVARLAGLDDAPPAPAAGARKTGSPGPAEVEEPVAPRWYPVIDYSRCTNCLECLNFCLFGVFGLDESAGVLVEEPDACRHGCPACARVCPSGAIMFPQHADPAIAGNGSAASDDATAGLVQLVMPQDDLKAAEQERRRALEEQKHRTGGESPKGKGSPRKPRGDLDRLVDELDDLDL